MRRPWLRKPASGVGSLTYRKALARTSSLRKSYSTRHTAHLNQPTWQKTARSWLNSAAAKAFALAVTHSNNWAKSESTTLAGHRLNFGARRFFIPGRDCFNQTLTRVFLKPSLVPQNHETIVSPYRGQEIPCAYSPVSDSLLLIYLRHEFLNLQVLHAHVQNSRRSVALQ
jgi:hypothetical protein